MELLAQPYPECSIRAGPGYIRADIGSGTSSEIQDCYRRAAEIALGHRFLRVLIVGVGENDAHSHLAARDIIIALHQLGVPAGFKMAFVPKSDVTLNGYRHAEIEANNRGLRAKVFQDEKEAARWLTEAELH